MKQHWKPGTLEAPVPAVMVTCGTMEASNIITIAWTGIVCSDPAMLSISVRPQRHSYAMIKEQGEFTVNLTTRDLVQATDLCGVVSGAKQDKFELCHLDKEEGVHVACPGIAQSPIQLECKVKQVLPLGSHDLFLAEIVGVNVEESLLDANGRLQLEKANLIAYSHGSYYALGKMLGTFGYSVRKKKGKNHAAKSRS